MQGYSGVVVGQLLRHLEEYRILRVENRAVFRLLICCSAPRILSARETSAWASASCSCSGNPLAPVTATEGP